MARSPRASAGDEFLTGLDGLFDLEELLELISNAPSEGDERKYSLLASERMPS